MHEMNTNEFNKLDASVEKKEFGFLFLIAASSYR